MVRGREGFHINLPVHSKDAGNIGNYFEKSTDEHIEINISSKGRHHKVYSVVTQRHGKPDPNQAYSVSSVCHYIPVA